MSYIDLPVHAVQPGIVTPNKQIVFAKTTGLFLSRIWSDSQGSAGPLPGYPLTVPDPTPLVLGPGGWITVNQMYHTVDTYSMAASDDLINLQLPVDHTGFNMVILRPLNDARSIVVKHQASGHIRLQGGVDITLDDTTDHILLFYTGFAWVNLL